MDQMVEIWMAPIQAKTTRLSCTSTKNDLVAWADTWSMFFLMLVNAK